MTAPRQILPGRTYVIARRTTQRQYLLRPDDVTNNTFSYCLAESAARFGISLIGWMAMSNHYHAIVHDADGLLPAFLEHFHRSIAQAMNAHLNRVENFWATTQTSVVLLPTRQAIVAQMVYILANPVAALLVERAMDWPGASSLAYLDGKQTVHLRPRDFFSATGRMSSAVELAMKLPTALGIDPGGFAAQVRSALQEREAAIREERLRGGLELVGRKAVLKQSPFGSPTSPRDPRTIRPSIATTERELARAWLAERRAFLEAYESAKQRFRQGQRDTAFPLGTWKFKRLGALCQDELSLAA